MATSIPQITTHVVDAQARLLQQYRDKVQMPGLVAACAGRAQVVENALYAVLSQRWFSGSPTGQQLDNIGKMVGRARNTVPGGASDAVYLKWLQAQIAINRGGGTIADVEGIMALVADAGATVAVAEQFPASIAVRVFGAAQSQPAALQAILRQAKAAGVRAVLEYAGTTAAATFALDGTTAQALDNGLFVGAL